MTITTTSTRVSMTPTRTDEVEAFERGPQSHALGLGRGRDGDRSLRAGSRGFPLSFPAGEHSGPFWGRGGFADPGGAADQQSGAAPDSDHANARLVESRFAIMSTQAGLWLDSVHPQAELALQHGSDLLHRLAKQLTRFSADSELSGLNALAGHGPVPVSPWLFDVVEAALRLAELSSGLFDPTVLPHLVRAGYGQGPRQGKVGYRSVRLDGQACTVELDWGVALDLGGVAKGWAADWVAGLLSPYGSALVDLGGDLACCGRRSWLVGVEDPFSPHLDLCHLELKQGGVATSSTLKRAWVGGHHLIDPRTGRPVISDLVAATVIASSATLAEGGAKTALLLGEERGRDFLRAAGLRGVLVKSDGAVKEVSVP